ncbi:MAG: HlyD family secretion protein [Cytophagaceae bacterium]|nr:HlyD family secretion protein [Cytophagaceae bacterium]MDW8455561.1 HlyD family efflux transporter periplasmic adaptor subunit [Cytophagaceae bacterium]
MKIFEDEKTILAQKFYSVELLSEPRLARTMLRWCIGLFIGFVIILFLPWTQNISSTGVITRLNPQNRPQTINATIAGRIEKWYVQEGSFVKKGDTIIMLSEVKEKYFDPQLIQRLTEQVLAKQNSLAALKDKINAQKNQINALKTALEYSLNKARNKVLQNELKVKTDSTDLEAIKVEYNIARLQYERQEALYKDGLKSLTELEQRKLKFQEVTAKKVMYENKLNATKQELINSRIELNSLQAEYTDKISKAVSELNSTEAYAFSTEAEISKMNNELSNMKIRSSYYVITAPQDGYVVNALRYGIGEIIKEGEPVLKILPNRDDIAVELYVKPMDMPLIYKGAKVRLQFDGWPALVFSGWPNVSYGTFGGIIQNIDLVDTKGKYRILVVPDPNDEKWPEQLTVGSGVYGWAMLKDVPIWYEIWRDMNGFPPDYIDHEIIHYEHYEDSKEKSKKDK